MVRRYVKPPYSRLVIAGVLFQVAAFIVFTLAATNAMTGESALAGVTGTAAAGLLLHLLLLIFNMAVRAEHAAERDDARMMLSADQWYAAAAMIGCILTLIVTVGIWLGNASASTAGTLALALVSVPALSILTFAPVLPREAYIELEEVRTSQQHQHQHQQQQQQQQQQNPPPTGVTPGGPVTTTRHYAAVGTGMPPAFNYLVQGQAHDRH